MILLNTVIEDVCRKAQVEYVDNMQTFLMLNGEPNDAYLLPDGLHLSKNGTVRLIKNLKLTDEAKHQDHRRKHKTSNHPSTKESTNKEYEKVYFAGRKHPLSNYYPSPLTVCGHTFPHLEGAYQTIGCLVSNQREKAEEIMRIQDPLTAMREGQKVKKGELWENTKVEVMRSLLHMKANQCPSYYDALMATGNSELVEDTHHQFWGRGKDNTGVNMCGILNAEVRSSLQRKIDPNTKEMPHWQKLLMDIPASKQPTIQNEQVKGKIVEPASRQIEYPAQRPVLGHSTKRSKTDDSKQCPDVTHSTLNPQAPVWRNNVWHTPDVHGIYQPSPHNQHYNNTREGWHHWTHDWPSVN